MKLSELKFTIMSTLDALLFEGKANLTLKKLFINSEKVLGKPHKQDRTIKILKTQASFGVKSLTVRAEAHGEKDYDLAMTFYGVSYGDELNDVHTIMVKSSDGTKKYMKKLDVNVNPVRVNCTCPWFRFASEWYLKSGDALTPNKKARPYTKVKGSTRPPINPKKLPCVCKHLYQFALELQKRGMLSNI